MNNCILNEPFILPLDSNQRLLASLAFISEVTDGDKGLKQSRDIGPSINHWDDDKLFQSIEKCQFYRKLTYDDDNDSNNSNSNNSNNNNNSNRLSLHKKANSLLNKFSEYGDNLLLCNKDIQVARISLTEISTSWLNLIDLFISYSSASSLPLYLLFEHNNEYSVIHIPPLINGNDGQYISLFQINKDVHLYSRTLNDLKFLLDRWIQPFRKIIESDKYNDDILEFSIIIIVQSNWCSIDDKGNKISINDRLESLQRILETQRQTEKEENINSMKIHLEKLQSILIDNDVLRTSNLNTTQSLQLSNKDSKFLRDSRESNCLRDSEQSYGTIIKQSNNFESSQLPIPPSRLSSSRNDLRYSNEPSYPPPFVMETAKSQTSLSSTLDSDILPTKIDTSISKPSLYDEDEIRFTKKNNNNNSNTAAVRFSVANNLSESVVADLMRSQEGEDLNSYGLRAYEMIKQKVFGKLNLHVSNSIEQFNNSSDIPSNNNLNKSVTRSISDIKEMKETAKGTFSPLSASANRDVDEILRKWNQSSSQDNHNSFSHNTGYDQEDNRDNNEAFKNSEYDYDISAQLNDDTTVNTEPGFYSFMREELSPDRRSPSKKSTGKKATDLYPINEQDPRIQSTSNPWSPANSPRSLTNSLKTSPVNTFPVNASSDNKMLTNLFPPTESPKTNKSETNSISSPQRLSFALSPKPYMKQKQSDIPVSPAHSSSNSMQPSKEAIEYTAYHLNRSANDIRSSPSLSRVGLSPKSETKSSIASKPQVLMSQHSPNLRMRIDPGTSSSPYVNNSRVDELSKVTSSLQKSFYELKPQISSPISSPIQFPQSQSLFGDNVSPQRNSLKSRQYSPQQSPQQSPRYSPQQLTPQRNSLQIEETAVESADINENDDITIIDEEMEKDCDTTIDDEEYDTRKEINTIVENIQNEQPMIRASLSNLISNEMARNRSSIEGKRIQILKERSWKRKEQGLHILSLVLANNGNSNSNSEKNVHTDKGIYHPQKQKGVSIPTSQIEVRTKKGLGESKAPEETTSKREKGKVWDINVNIEPKRPQQRGASAGPLQKRAHAYSNADVGDISSVGTPRVTSDRAQSAGKSRRGDSEQRVSNQQQIKNALTAVCLAGSHFDNHRSEAISKLDQYYATRDNGGPSYGPINQFIILLFNAKSLSFRGIYAVSPINGEIFKIFGKGPKLILSNYVQDYLKYETASRTFKILPTKNLSATVDAISVDPAKLKKLIS